MIGVLILIDAHDKGIDAKAKMEEILGIRDSSFRILISIQYYSEKTHNSFLSN
jgi:hypothetical protein